MSQPDSKLLYVTKLHLKGYKSVIDCEFELKKELNIIIGKNGAGKSNLFELIDSVIEYYPKDFAFQNASFEMQSLENNSFKVAYEKSISDLQTLKETPDSRFQIIRKIYINDKEVSDGFLNGDIVQEVSFKGNTYRLGVNTGAFFVRIKHRFPFALYLKYTLPEVLDAINISSDFKVEKSSGVWETYNTLNFIKEIFWNLETAFIEDGFKALNLNKQDFLEKVNIDSKIIDNLNRYSPIENIRFNENISVFQTEREIIVSNLRLDFYVNDSWIPWSQLSDGTKRLFYLITEITAKETGLILIEEPELGIHPHQFELLMDFIKQESETKQILISTHSPKALDHLNKDELGNILIASYEKGKGTQVRNLTQEEKDHADKYMTEVGFLSDFWLYSDLEE